MRMDGISGCRKSSWKNSSLRPAFTVKMMIWLTFHSFQKLKHFWCQAPRHSLPLDTSYWTLINLLWLTDEIVENTSIYTVTFLGLMFCEKHVCIFAAYYFQHALPLDTSYWTLINLLWLTDEIIENTSIYTVTFRGLMFCEKHVYIFAAYYFQHA